MINQLWSNILWGQRSNFVGVPTDCPQRDERLGWTGDAEVFWRAASYNMDLDAILEEIRRRSASDAGWHGHVRHLRARHFHAKSPATAQAGATPESSFRGQPGCSREIPASSNRIGTR